MLARDPSIHPIPEARVRIPHRVIVALLSTLILGCVDASEPVAVDRTLGILNGTPTGTSYGAVGALLLDYNKDGVIDADDEWCSGTLIAPTLFLTAAHCVAPDPDQPLGSQFYVSFAPDLSASRPPACRGPARSSRWPGAA